MSVDDAAIIRALPGIDGPDIADSAFVAAGAVIVGDVLLAERSSVWYNAVLRAEAAPIVLGAGSNLQDNVVCHVDAGFPLTIGSGVSVGHSAVLHGCTVEDDCLIGMGATVLGGARVGTGSLVAAGAVVLEGTMVPAGSLVAGVPAKVRRQLTEEERDGIRRNADHYLGHVRQHSAPRE